jgi:hypothetical protein
MTIDTLEYVKKLEAAGVERKLAEAHAEALREAVAREVATKADVEAGVLRLDNRIDTSAQALRADFETRFQKLEAKLQLLTWMVGFNLAATMAILWKLLR